MDGYLTFYIYLLETWTLNFYSKYHEGLVSGSKDIYQG